MSIERHYSYFTAVCDYCGERLPGEMSFQDAVRAKRAAGWESRKTNDEWVDICGDCQFDEKGYSNDENNLH